jgi:hypothetical protein
MRRFAAGVVALAIGATPALIASSAHADANIGAFSSPFREDGFSPTSGFDATTGCAAPDEGSVDTFHPQGHVTCLPAGASVVQLADGRILYWNALEGFENIQFGTVPEAGSAAVNDQTRLLDLAKLPSTTAWSLPTPLRADEGTVTGRDSSLFCSDQVQLADGRILDAGGTDYYLEPQINEQFGVTELEGLKKSRIFNPTTNTWTESGAMGHGRWYPGLVTLADGKVFVASGVGKLIKPVYPDRPADSGTNVEQTETYDPATGLWTDNGATGNRSLPLFPRMHLLPDGHVFYDSAGQAFNPMGQSYDEALWNIAGSYDPATKTWTDLGIPGVDLADPVGTATNALAAEPGFRGSTFNQQLLLTAPYDKASFINAGGVVGVTPGSYLPTDSTRIDTVTINGDGTETLSSKPAGKLNQRRWYSSGVTLPDGNVLALSGANLDEVATPGFEQAIRQAELFDASTGTWKNVAIGGRERTYHNSAILLRDGRVLVGGNAPIPTGYGKVQTLPEVPGVYKFANNFHDASFELYSPPYLFRGTRPTIDSVEGDDEEVHHGSTLRIDTPNGNDITSVRLVRNPAFTHLVDGDQRVVDLPITAHDSDHVSATVPASSSVLPSGPYMVFVATGSGDTYIPSESEQILVNDEPTSSVHIVHHAAAAAPPVASLQQANTTVAAAKASANSLLTSPASATEPRKTTTTLLPLALIALVALAAASTGTRMVMRHTQRIVGGG